MPITALNSISGPRAFSVGPVKIQIMTYNATSGASSGVIVADKLSRLEHILLDGRIRYSAAPTYSGNAATLAFSVLAEVAASLVVQDITYTAAAGQGASGNSITIAYTTGGTAGAEVVSVIGNAISVQIQSGVSTATQVLAAINGSASALALVSAAITGTASNAQVAAAATPLAGGVFGGNNGTIICIGV